MALSFLSSTFIKSMMPVHFDSVLSKIRRSYTSIMVVILGIKDVSGLNSLGWCHQAEVTGLTY